MNTRTESNYRNSLGYVLENKALHVCGYKDREILFQDVRISYTQITRKLVQNSEGIYFNYNKVKNFVLRF